MLSRRSHLTRIIAYVFETILEEFIFTSAAQKNFGKPVGWALVKDHAWSTPQLRKLDQPVRAAQKFLATLAMYQSAVVIFSCL